MSFTRLSFGQRCCKCLKNVTLLEIACSGFGHTFEERKRNNICLVLLSHIEVRGYYEVENTIFMPSITFVNILLDINHVVLGCIVTIWFTMYSIFITLFKTDM